MKFQHVILFLLAAALSTRASDDAAVIAALTGARNLKKTGEGFQLVTQGGQWMRAVRTMDGGYSIFSTNGSARLFPTPMGFGYRGPSNVNSSVTMNPRGFTIAGPSGTVTMVKAGSAWLKQNAQDNERIIMDTEGWSTVSGPLAPMPADTIYELFMRREQLNEAPAFVQPAPRQTDPVAAPPQPQNPARREIFQR